MRRAPLPRPAPTVVFAFARADASRSVRSGLPCRGSRPLPRSFLSFFSFLECFRFFFLSFFSRLLERLPLPSRLRCGAAASAGRPAGA
jgi:hypothetical protein